MSGALAVLSSPYLIFLLGMSGIDGGIQQSDITAQDLVARQTGMLEALLVKRVLAYPT